MLIYINFTSKVYVTFDHFQFIVNRKQKEHLRFINKLPKTLWDWVKAIFKRYQDKLQINTPIFLETIEKIDQ